MISPCPDPGRQTCHASRSSCQDGAMPTDVAVVVAAPVPAFELGIVSEVFGLRRMDPELPTYRYAVCAETRTRMPTTTHFSVTPTHTLRRLETADLKIGRASCRERV